MLQADEKYNVTPIKNIYVDTGFKNKSDVLKNGIEIGSPVTYAPYYKQLSNNVCGSSLDDRAGCVVILNVAISLMKLKKDQQYILFFLFKKNLI